MHIPGYRVIRKINQGGMSTVYLAIQISVGRVVALKVMSPTLNGDPSFSERFQREANIVGQLSHSIYDIGRHENLNYIAMDYLPGGSVHDRMMTGINTADAARITCEIAIALDHAHEKGYIQNYKFIDDINIQGIIKIALKYNPESKASAIENLERISKPGLRKYAGSKEVPRILNGLGIAIVSTSKGLMTDKEARVQNVGGEVLCYVY